MYGGVGGAVSDGRPYPDVLFFVLVLLLPSPNDIAPSAHYEES
jgi:hypothetical protein